VTPRAFLRVEGLVALALAFGGYLVLDGPLPVLVVAGLAPDLSILAYRRGPRAGALGYNVAHTYAVPGALLAAGHLGDAPLATFVALAWAAHLGLDRALGYGLKEETGFRDTHLSTGGAPLGALLDRE
jgi:hypothetical protein